MSAATDEKKKTRAVVKPYQLLPYQKQGVTWCINRERPHMVPRGGILADEPGLGKTVQMYHLIAHGLSKDDGQTTLILVPKSMSLQWHQESKPSLPVEHHARVLRYLKSKPLLFSDDEHDTTNDQIVILGYGSLLSMHELAQTTDVEKQKLKQKYGMTLYRSSWLPRYRLACRWTKRVWTRIILDESTEIRNANTQIAKATCALFAERRWCVSGTPYQNGVWDLWSQCKFLKCAPQDTKEWWQDDDKCNENSVAEWKSNVLLRRLKTEVQIKLPEVVETVHKTGFTTAETASWNDILEQTATKLRALRRAKVTNDRLYHAMNVACLRLRQLSNDLRLLPKRVYDAIKDDKDGDDDGDDDGGRAEEMNDQKAETVKEGGVDGVENTGSKTKQIGLVLQRILVEHAGEKVLVFSQWPSYFPYLYGFVGAVDGAECATVSGAQTGTERETILNAFRTNPAVRVLFVTLKCGGVGLNLVEANHVLMCDAWFNPFVERQAIDRTHRIGQTRPVHVHVFQSDNRVERCMVQLKTQKERAAAVCVETNEKVNHALNESELKGKENKDRFDFKQLEAVFIDLFEGRDEYADVFGPKKKKKATVKRASKKSTEVGFRSYARVAPAANSIEAFHEAFSSTSSSSSSSSLSSAPSLPTFASVSSRPLSQVALDRQAMLQRREAAMARAREQQQRTLSSSNFSAPQWSKTIPQQNYNSTTSQPTKKRKALSSSS